MDNNQRYRYYQYLIKAFSQIKDFEVEDRFENEVAFEKSEKNSFFIGKSIMFKNVIESHSRIELLSTMICRKLKYRKISDNTKLSIPVGKIILEKQGDPTVQIEVKKESVRYTVILKFSEVKENENA